MLDLIAVRFSPRLAGKSRNKIAGIPKKKSTHCTKRAPISSSLWSPSSDTEQQVQRLETREQRYRDRQARKERARKHTHTYTHTPTHAYSPHKHNTEARQSRTENLKYFTYIIPNLEYYFPPRCARVPQGGTVAGLVSVLVGRYDVTCNST